MAVIVAVMMALVQRNNAKEDETNAIVRITPYLDLPILIDRIRTHRFASLTL
jgi:hypothetical protein